MGEILNISVDLAERGINFSIRYKDQAYTGYKPLRVIDKLLKKREYSLEDFILDHINVKAEEIIEREKTLNNETI